MKFQETIHEKRRIFMIYEFALIYLLGFSYRLATNRHWMIDDQSSYIHALK